MTRLADPIDAIVVKDPQDARRAALGSFLGATLEFYDFAIYSTASALIFPAVFFSGLDSAVGITLSYVTLAAGYIARPLGAIVFGHFGDRLGRRQMLVITMIVMGSASIGIGLIPSSTAIGPMAAVILVALRIVQGVAVGGEWAGASLMSIEHARSARRGFAGAIVQSGGPSGGVLATVTFALVSLMPEYELLTWGWRIPFLASAVVVIVAIVVRLGVKESPEFLAADTAHSAGRIPLFATFAKNWRSVVIVVLTALSPFFLQSVTTTFGLQLAIGQGLAQPSALWMLTISNVLTIGATLGFAALSDRYGRVRIMILGFVASGTLVWLAFPLLARGESVAVLVGFIILMPIGNAMITGPLAAYMADLFPVHTRFTGVGVSYQLAATVAAGFAPLIATSLFAATQNTLLVCLLISVLAAVGLGAAVASRRIHAGLGR